MLCGYPELHRPRHGRHQSTTCRWRMRASRGSPRTGSSSSAIRSASPRIEVLTIGAGGGSLAWIDEAGSLRNGPQSAGADPGPACYGQRQPAADQHRCQCRARAARHQPCGRQDHARSDSWRRRGRGRRGRSLCNLELHEAADAIIRVANANMSDAVRLISISRGYDPRDFALVAFGGAGALHGLAIAQGTRDPGRDRAAQSRRHLGARLSAGRRAARSFGELHPAGGDADPAGDRSARSRRWKPKPGNACATRAWRRPDVVTAAHDRHDVPGPVALAGGAGRQPGRLARRAGRGVSSAARARIQFPPRRARRSDCSAST